MRHAPLVFARLTEKGPLRLCGGGVWDHPSSGQISHSSPQLRTTNEKEISCCPDYQVAGLIVWGLTSLTAQLRQPQDQVEVRVGRDAARAQALHPGVRLS